MADSLDHVGPMARSVADVAIVPLARHCPYSPIGAQTIVDVRKPDLSGVLDIWRAICGSEMAAAHAAT